MLPSSSLDRKIIFLFITGLCIFGFSTLHLLSHLSLPLPRGGIGSINFDRHYSPSGHENSNISNDVHGNNVSATTNRKKHSVKQIIWDGQLNGSDDIITRNKVAQTLQKGDNKIPFPQSIFNEDWETINHPAIDLVPTLIEQNSNEKASAAYAKLSSPITVPKFWNPPFFKGDVRRFLGNYGEKLMTPEEAGSIGSFTIPTKDWDEEEERLVEEEESAEDDKYVSVVQKIIVDLPPEELEPLETIFVSISSYRDNRCRNTVQHLFDNASHPERIRVTIVNQIDQNSDDASCKKPKKPCDEHSDNVFCEYSHLIEEYIMDDDLAVGPVFARHIGSRMYRGEYFALQIDAHMEFINDWDQHLIEEWKATNNEMAVLTTYVSDVENHYNETTGESMTDHRPKMCNTDFDEEEDILMHGQQPEGPIEMKGEAILQPQFAAGFSFSRGHFVVQVPYDQYLPMIFQGEEISMGLRGFTFGYDYYSPQKNILFHYYSLGGKRKVKKFWEHANDYKGVKNASKARLLGISQLVNKNDSENLVWNDIERNKYGIGNIRTTKKFLDTFGIDIDTGTVQHHMCKFVGAAMNKLFIPHLRSNGMGIDYDNISFQFKDPVIYGNTWEMRNEN